MEVRSHHKVIIIGSGPSGLAAAVYLSRAQLEPLMFAGEKSGGQLMLTTDVENYPGFPQGIMGPELMVNMRAQAERFGTVMQDVNVTKVDFSKSPFKVWAASGKAGAEELYTADAVLISTGAETVWIGVPGEQEFLGRGVSSCAVCDAAFYKEKDTIVVGGGDAAMEDALALTKFAKSVTIIHRRDAFRASKIMAQRVLKHPKVTVMWNTQLKEIQGSKVVERAVVIRDGKEETIQTDGVFVAIGHNPSTSLFKGQLALNERGFLVTRLGLEKESVALAQQAIVDGKVAFPTMTSVEGVFAAGDVVDFRYKQAATAAGMGVMAALDVEWWLER